MKILITGSTGFVGRHLIPILLDRGHRILELTRNEERSYELYQNRTSKFDLTQDQQSLKAAIADFEPDAAIHLAAFLTSADDYQTLNKLLESNIQFFCRVLDALKDSAIKLFVNTGTFAEYAQGNGILNPAYLYAATKTASRAFLDYYSATGGYKQVTVVPYTVYGGNDSQKKIIDLIYDSLDSNTPLDLSPGNQVLDFIHVNDVANFYLHLIESVDLLQSKTIFQLGTGKGTTIRELAKIIEQKTGKVANINWGGKPYRPSDVMYAVADVAELRKINWEAKCLMQ